MKVTPRAVKIKLRDARLREMGVGRSAGLHLSDVLNYIEASSNPRKRFSDNDLWAQMGFFWETVIAEVLPAYLEGDLCSSASQLIPVREVERDGIFMSPDSFEIGPWELWEFKATWRSLRKFDDDLDYHFQRWLWQIKAYCYAMDTRTANLCVFFVNGDYSYRDESGGPQMRVVRLEFTRAEIAENWRMVVNNAREMRRVGWRRKTR